MERNSEKRRRAKYATGQPILPIVKYRDDDEDARGPDNRWKYRQGNEVDPNNDRNERQLNFPIDHNEVYYRTTENVPRGSRKQRDGLSSSSRMRYVVPHIHDEFHDDDNKNQKGMTRLSRNQLLRQYVNEANCAKSIAIVRKNRYVDDFDGADELEETTFNDNENPADVTSEEVVDVERRENSTEFNDKYYEEHEADDEIDEESEMLERQVDKTRGQRKIRMQSLPRARKISGPLVPLMRHHRGGKIGTGKTSERCCHSATDRRIPEVPTDDEDDAEPEIRESSSHWPKKLSTRSRQDEEMTAWMSGRKMPEHCTDLPEKNRRTRGPRATRPEIVKSMKSANQEESISNIKCDRCGGTSGHTPKTASSRNATCRLQDSRYFVDDTIGNEIFEEPSNGPMTYRAKPRRTKDARSTIYETNEKGLPIGGVEDADVNGAIYKSCRVKNSRETTNPRRSSLRAVDRYDEKINSKNSKRYWA